MSLLLFHSYFVIIHTFIYPFFPLAFVMIHIFIYLFFPLICYYTYIYLLIFSSGMFTYRKHNKRKFLLSIVLFCHYFICFSSQSLLKMFLSYRGKSDKI